MEKKIFYKTDSLIFKRSRELRNHITHTEMLMWGYLRTRPAGFKFREQHCFHNYIVDFYFLQLKLLIKIDGSIHNRSDVKEYSNERENAIRSPGIEILRFTNKDVLYKPDSVVEKLNCFIQNVLTQKQKGVY